MRTFLGAVAVAVALAGCGGTSSSGGNGGSATPTIDHARLVQEMHSWALKNNVVPPSESGVRVQCPGGIPVKAASTFHCIISGGQQRVRVTVTIENNKGYLTWVVG